MPEATYKEYLAMVGDRPGKFSAAQVNYGPAQNPRYKCANCWHFYSSKTAKRSVCEIFRPTGDVSVRPDYECKFWTDGREYPLLESKVKSLVGRVN